MFKIKNSAAFILAAALALSLAACGEAPEQPAEGRSVTDSVGREVVVPETVESIVVLGNAPRMAVYLGLDDMVAGYSGMTGGDKIGVESGMTGGDKEDEI